MTTPALFQVPEAPVPRKATKVFLAIELPEEDIPPSIVWPQGDPGEGWGVEAVRAEMLFQYGESVSLCKLVEEWGIAGMGGELILRDDAGGLIRMELRP